VDLHLLRPKTGLQMIRVTSRLSSWKKIMVQDARDHSDVKNLSNQLLYWMCCDKPTLTICGNQHPVSHYLVHNNLGRGVQCKFGVYLPRCNFLLQPGARRLELEFHTSSLERGHHKVIWTVKFGQILGCMQSAFLYTWYRFVPSRDSHWQAYKLCFSLKHEIFHW
jgi:hypothetical protein